MKSRSTLSFWQHYWALPPEIRQRARQAYKLWRDNPAHPSLFFKRVKENQPVPQVKKSANLCHAAQHAHSPDRLRLAALGSPAGDARAVMPLRKAKSFQSRWRCRMADQVQCPNCGGYKTEVTVKYIGVGVLYEFLGCAVVVLTGVLAGGFVLWWFYALASGNILPPLVATGVLLVVAVVGLILQLSRLHKQQYHEVPKEYSYKCHLCGYQWTWRTDEPKPRVTVRPDLIVRGEQKLEEEREEERRRRDAGGMFYPPPWKK